MSKRIENKIYLGVHEIPKAWYNIQADLPTPVSPSLHPQTLKPAQAEDMAPIFAQELVKQEVNTTDRFIEIPQEVQEAYTSWRSTPLIRATFLEKALDTPAKIYYKYEGNNASGSHKLNSAIAQVYYNKQEGIKRIATETGAGQWACALSIACDRFDLECMVYMVKVSYEGKPYRRSFMQLFNGKVVPSPSTLTQYGRNVLAEDPNCSGSLGIAIGEALEDTLSREDTHYCLGSVLNHVSLHQTVIGEEALLQMEKAGDYPDVVIACCGGGSNFSGIAFPFLKDKLSGEKPDLRCVAVEPTSCPTLTRGVFAYDYGDTAGLAPVVEMYTLGRNFIPPGIHAGGLRYHGASPILSRLYHDKLVEAKAYKQTECFDAALLFAREEGILPAPESSHAIKAAIDEALAAKESGEEKTILFCLSGNGIFDMQAYDNYKSGKLEDMELDEALLKKSLADLPQV
ncbi:MAG: TrpB-like pyridoxal phosphate-dependent enzyme [Bacillota bacterium]|jgi:tryptophan synthase beta chain